MRLGARPDTLIEWLALKLNWAPVPLADTHLSFSVCPHRHGGHETWFLRSPTGCRRNGRRRRDEMRDQRECNFPNVGCVAGARLPALPRWSLSPQCALSEVAPRRQS
jgi:hypothetical protein